MEVGAQRYIREGSANKLICAQGSSIDLKLKVSEGANEISSLSPQLLVKIMSFLRLAISSLSTALRPL